MLVRHARLCLRAPALRWASPYSVDASAPQTDVVEAEFPFNRTTSGLSVRVNSATSIHVATGSMDSVRLSIRAQNARTRFSVDLGATAVEVAETTADDQPGVIHAWIPERYCNVALNTSGGAITLQGVSEANVSANSNGGDMDVGKIKAVDAELQTGGGTLSGSVTAGVVKISTAGGALDLKRLVGTHVALTCGTARIGACYTDSLHVDTDGAALDVRHLSCTGPDVHVMTRGGSIAVGGMDGVGTLNSAGGDIDVQIAEKAQCVALFSGGGTVSVAVAPALAAEFEVGARGGITLSNGLTLEGFDAGRTSAKGRKQAEAAANAASSAKLTSDVATVRIDAAGGAVSLCKQSWQASVEERMRNGKS